MATAAAFPVTAGDYAHVFEDQRTNRDPSAPRIAFSMPEIDAVSGQITAVPLGGTVSPLPGVFVSFFPAGHQLGAAMVYVRTPAGAVLYSGDFNPTPNLQLPAARLPFGLRPDLLLVEGSYATVVRGLSRPRDFAFVSEVVHAVRAGSKVLLPVFTFGRAQEVCALLDDIWDRMGLAHVPLSVTAGLLERATGLYASHSCSLAGAALATRTPRSPFRFKHVGAYSSASLQAPGPACLLAAPGTASSGTALDALIAWGSDPRTKIIFPGHATRKSMSFRLVHRLTGAIQSDNARPVPINADTKHLAFPAHADCRGIAELILAAKPTTVALIHGQRDRLAAFQNALEQAAHVRAHLITDQRPFLIVPVASPLVTAVASPPIPVGPASTAPCTSALPAEDSDFADSSEDAPPPPPPQLYEGNLFLSRSGAVLGLTHGGTSTVFQQQTLLPPLGSSQPIGALFPGWAPHPSGGIVQNEVVIIQDPSGSVLVHFDQRMENKADAVIDALLAAGFTEGPWAGSAAEAALRNTQC
jgi:integrator complex subunit 11